jgi:hypothetical protein
MKSPSLSIDVDESKPQWRLKHQELFSQSLTLFDALLSTPLGHKDAPKFSLTAASAKEKYSTPRLTVLE